MAGFPHDIEYHERGSGPALLFLPGSFGTGAGWRPVVEALGNGYRFVTTSLLGYGATTERRPLGNATMRQQVEVIDQILTRIDAPTQIVAHSFGGLAALAHAIDGHNRASSLTLLEATPFSILRTIGDDEHYAMFTAMTDVYFAEFAAGRPDAVRHVIDFYGGAGSFAAMPPKVRDYVMATTESNIRDWSSATPFAPPLATYRALEVPTLVVRGGSGHPAMMRIADAIATNIPSATLETIDGGSHFLPASHPREVAALVSEHLRRVTG